MDTFENFKEDVPIFFEYSNSPFIKLINNNYMRRVRMKMNPRIGLSCIINSLVGVDHLHHLVIHALSSVV